MTESSQSSPPPYFVAAPPEATGNVAAEQNEAGALAPHCTCWPIQLVPTLVLLVSCIVMYTALLFALPPFSLTLPPQKTRKPIPEPPRSDASAGHVSESRLRLARLAFRGGARASLRVMGTGKSARVSERLTRVPIG